MPISLVALQKKKVRLDLDYDGDKVFIEYQPEHINEATLSLERELRVTGDMGRLSEALAALITGWDIYADANDKTPMPITAENIAALGVPFRIWLYNTLTTDAMARATPKR